MLHIKFTAHNQNEHLTHFVCCNEYTVMQSDKNQFKVVGEHFSLEVKAIRNDTDVLKDLIFTLHIRGKKISANMITYNIRDTSTDNWKQGKQSDLFFKALADWVRV
ncbi:hypothetical protein P0J00_003451 [Vibrio vulnificus]|nr:hypothetical protein [Vibrio vulnificus]EKO5193464.1 hypothetical protein [Vibrio vulnificus]